MVNVLPTRTLALAGVAKVIIPTGSGGVTAALATDAAPVPAEFVAVTVNVYAVPFVRPVTTNGLIAPLTVAPPGLAVTVKPVIRLPPLNAGAVKATDTCPAPAAPTTPVGAPGTTEFTVNVLLIVVAAPKALFPG